MKTVYKKIVFFLAFAQVLYLSNIYGEHMISFIMPCYNADKLEHALASIYKQKIDYPFEVICCDDGSTDDTFTRLLTCKRLCPNLKVVRHVTNKGAGAAANTCVKHSKGDLLYRLDSDNMLPEVELEVINKLVTLLDASGCDAAMVETMVLFEGGHTGGDRNIKALWRYEAPSLRSSSFGGASPDFIWDLEHCVSVAHDPAMSGNFLVKRSAYNRVGGYPEDHGSDTFRFGFKLYATGGKVAILKGAWYWHFYNPNGYWWREQKSGNNDAKALDTVMEFKDRFTRISQRYLHDAELGKTTLFLLINNNMLKLKYL